mmetsp:Transcript_67222/g.186231  ORF Transcript_67222/g.186231 Transcript_67222/m.186231 type:complete len:224 (+) Transcript_67222:360-1031(+)
MDDALEDVHAPPPGIPRILVDQDVRELGVAAVGHVLAVRPDEEEEVPGDAGVEQDEADAAAPHDSAREGRPLARQDARQVGARLGEGVRLHGEEEVHRDGRGQVEQVEPDERLVLRLQAPRPQEDERQPREAVGGPEEVEAHVPGHGPGLARREGDAEHLDDEEGAHQEVEEEDQPHAPGERAAAAELRCGPAARHVWAAGWGPRWTGRTRGVRYRALLGART